MILRGSQTISSEFEVCEEAIIDAYLKIVRNNAKFNYNWYLKDDNFIYIDEDSYTSHSWTTTIKVREATEEEIKIFKHIEMVRNLQYEKRNEIRNSSKVQ